MKALALNNLSARIIGMYHVMWLFSASCLVTGISLGGCSLKKKKSVHLRGTANLLPLSESAVFSCMGFMLHLVTSLILEYMLLTEAGFGTFVSPLTYFACFKIFCVCVCLNMHTTCVQCIRSPGTGVISGYESPCRC